jgi:hypothetical protein
MQSLHGHRILDYVHVYLILYYFAVHQAATKRKDAAMARVFFLKMRAALITPTEKVYCALIRAHIAEGDLK